MNGHSNHGGGGESPAVAVPVYRPAYNSGVTAMAGLDPWASANQGITNYTNTLLGLSQMKRQDMNDQMAMEDRAQRSKLVDLQTQAAQQTLDDQTALRSALATAKGGYLYPEPQGVGPHLPGPRVGISALAPQEQPASAEDRLAVMADLASKGNTAAMELYGKTESLTQKLAEHKAQAEVYGNAENAAKVDAVLKKMDASGKALENWMKVDPSGELARQQIAANPVLFNGMDSSKMQLGDGKKTPPVFFPAADGGFTFYDGKEWKHVKAETPSADKFQLTEVPSPDGKTAQKMRVNMTDGTMTPLGKPYAVKSQVPNVNVTTGNSNNTDFRNESAMRKEFLSLPEVKEFPTIESNAKRAIKALRSQGGSNVAVDQTIITVFNKMLDPTSVVRESEYARTPQDLSLLSRIKGKWDKVQHGGAGLDKTEREALARMVGNFTEIAGQQYNDQVAYYSGLAERYGYKPENVVRLGGRKADIGGGAASPTSDAGAFVKQQYAEYRKAGLKEDEIRQRVSSKLRKAGWKDSQIAAALRENSGNSGPIVTKGGFKVTKVE